MAPQPSLPSDVTLVEDAADAGIVGDFCAFLVTHYGSVLKAWRFVLDPSGDGELLYPEFIEAIATMPLWHGDVTALWAALMRRSRAHADEGTNRGEAELDDHVPAMVLSLRELAADDHQCLEDFRRWADALPLPSGDATSSGGVLELFKKATDGKPNAMMTFLEFVAACQSYGFKGDCHYIYYGCLCPGSEKGASLREVAYLESKALKRKGAMDPGFVLQTNSAKAAAKRLRERKRRLERQQTDALDEFLRKVRKAYGGSLIRGWRRVLDLNGNLTISKTELLKGCKKIAYAGDVVALWKAMDVDDDGIVQLEEVDVQLALILASFKKWATEENGSCVSTVLHLGNITKRQTSKWDQEGFFLALRCANFEVHLGNDFKQAATALYEAFDIKGLGHFTVQDVSFLDKWTPTPWLVADPCEEDKEGFMKALRSRYPNLIVAWRKLLDRDNSNRVSYKEFLEACRIIKTPNPAGVWRALDDDASGYITLNEIDQASADILLNFKRWAEETFGTISHMFHVFDQAKSGNVNFSVFRRALRNFSFGGDAAVLFQSLKPSSSGKSSKKSHSRNELTLQDLLYLSSWECEPGKDDMAAEEGAPPPISPSAESTAEAATLEAKAVDPLRTRARHVKGNPQNRGRLPAIAPAKETSEAMSFCRGADEYRAFLAANERQKFLDEHASSRQRLPQILPHRAVGTLLHAPAVGGRRLPQRQARFMSAGQLQPLPGVPVGGVCTIVPGDEVNARRLQEVTSLPVLAIPRA